ncbi:hypothetical protein LTR86_011197 [Recurvomyces mirabilis]|nr:hypothetical protein LTR86_011197 [Recurvomyces mirabilis]
METSCQSVASIKSDVELVLSTKQYDSAAVVEVYARLAAAIERCANNNTELAALQDFCSMLFPLSDLAYWHKEPRNVFRKINMGEFTLLGLLSPLSPATMEDCPPSTGGVRYIHFGGQPGDDGVPARAKPVSAHGTDGVKNDITEQNLANHISRFIRKGYKLVRRSQIVFNGIGLKEREMMLILSCTLPIIVYDVSGEEGSVFIVGQVTKATIEWICQELGVDFDPTEPDGVFQTVLR